MTPSVVTRELDEGVTEPENAHAATRQSDWQRLARRSCRASCRNLERGLAGRGLVRRRPALRDLHDQARRRGRGKAHRRPRRGSVSGFGARRCASGERQRRRPGLWRHALRRSGGRAIRDLKARGLKVTFYPFVLMDVPPGNAPPDPYGGRRAGGLSLARADHLLAGAGPAGSPDKTAAAPARSRRFVGTAMPQRFLAARRQP